jgi:diaminohydroxyphosphoribosylaminopyrimidine deaminase/5-amino-6-(5-phosphoribosylamino)uracil reductase
VEVEIGSPLSIEQAFRLALEEARKGFGGVSPNPPVGCVILDAKNRLLAKGHHQKFGGPHAEVEAFNRVEDKSLLHGAKFIVTLEPCSHFGKTPPCADLLSSLPLAEVHYGLKDPNPLVSGKGLEKIKGAGIGVFSAPPSLQGELEEVAEIFLHFQRQKKCFVGLKVASSLDGRMGLSNGESQWITNAVSREQGHLLRAYYGAVLTSATSVIKDDARLNVRVPPFESKKIPVFLLDRAAKSAEFLKTAKLMKVRSPHDVFIFTGKDNENKWASVLPEGQVLSAPLKEGNLDLAWILREISARGYVSVMVEAGPRLSSAFLSQGLFDRLELFLGNKILGDSPEGSWSKGLRLLKLDQALSLEALRIRTLGGDLWLSGRKPESF